MDKQFQVERDMVFYAMRYAMGRMTFAPLTVIDNIKHNIDLFATENLKWMIREIDEQKAYGYGMECDERVWLDFKSYLQSVIVIRENEVL